MQVMINCNTDSEIEVNCNTDSEIEGKDAVRTRRQRRANARRLRRMLIWRIDHREDEDAAQITDNEEG